MSIVHEVQERDENLVLKQDGGCGLPDLIHYRCGDFSRLQRFRIPTDLQADIHHYANAIKNIHLFICWRHCFGEYLDTQCSITGSSGRR